jgi:hypothetical protein
MGYLIKIQGPDKHQPITNNINYARFSKILGNYSQDPGIRPTGRKKLAPKNA